MYVSRRSVVVSALALASGTGGCVNHGDVSDLRISNRTDETITVSVTVSRSRDGAVVFDDTTVIDSGESKAFGDPIPEGGPVEVSVAIEGGPADSFGWDASSDAKGLIVFVRRDGIRFQEVE